MNATRFVVVGPFAVAYIRVACRRYVCFAVRVCLNVVCQRADSVVKLSVSNCVQRVREEQMFCAGGEEANRCRISS